MPSLTALGGPALSNRTASPLGDELRFHVEWLRDRVLLARPRLISVAQKATFHIFLDGACPEAQQGVEWCGTSVGGVLFDEHGVGLGSFGEILPPSVTKAWQRAGKDQLIFEAELLPYVIALHLWSDKIAGSNCFIYIDNETAKSSWINGSADLLHARHMIYEGASREAELNVTPYFCRVPTHSNLAEEPSRGSSFTICEELGARRMRVDESMLLMCAGLNHAYKL